MPDILFSTYVAGLPAGTADAEVVALDATVVKRLGLNTFATQAEVDGRQPLDADLTAIAGLTTAADRLPYFTGASTAALATFTAAGRALVDDASAAAQVTTLGLVAGTNTRLGTNAQAALTTGLANTAFGNNAQAALTTGGDNVAFGDSTQSVTTTGFNSTAVGRSAQQNLTTGGNNAAGGWAAQQYLTSGYDNTAFGTAAQRYLTTADNNTAVGRSAQGSLTTGYHDTAVGQNSQYAPGGVAANATTTALRQTSVGAISGLGSAVQDNDITTIGYSAMGTGAGATSLGSGAHAAFAGSVALGNGSVSTAIDQVFVGIRDIELAGNATKGLVMRSPDATRWRIKVANGGTLTVTAA